MMEQTLKKEIEEKIKRKLNSEIEETLVCDAIEETELLVLDYCNIDSVTANMKYIIINIACDFIKHDILSGRYSNESKVKSITRSEVSITYADDVIFRDKSEIISSYSKELNRYRKLRR